MPLFSERLIHKTQQLWEEDYKESLSDQEAQKVLEDLTGFYGLLLEWSQEEVNSKSA